MIDCLFSGHVPSERAGMARTQVRRIAIYVIELLMKRCVISSDRRDFLVITTKTLHSTIVLNLFKGEGGAVVRNVEPTRASGVCMYSPHFVYVIFLPLSMTSIWRL